MSWEIVAAVVCIVLFIGAFSLRKNEKWKWVWKFSFGLVPLLVFLLLTIFRNKSNENTEERQDKRDEKLKSETDKIRNDIEDAQKKAAVVEGTELQKMEDAKEKVRETSAEVKDYNEHMKDVADMDEDDQLKVLADDINKGD